MTNAEENSHRQVAVTCTASSGVPERTIHATCGALREILSLSEPPWCVLEPDEAEGIGNTVTLTILAAERQSLRAQLSWQTAASAGESPVMGFHIVDAALSREVIQGFIRQLLGQADWHD